MTDSPTPMLEIAGVTKRFPGVLALDRIAVGFRAGEVHAVIGENGAGKSTLMNILAGDLQPDGGEVRLDGRPRRFASPLDSRAAGIVVVYQELALCPTLSIAENIMMAEMAARPVASLVPRARMRIEARAALARLGMDHLDPDTKVGRLTVAEMQLVEIAGAVRQRARVLVLDEPNSALSRRESERLFEVVRQLKGEGVTVIYVSHHLREVLDLADRITVMRDGRTIETLDNDDLSEARLIRAMVGRELAGARPWSLDPAADSRGAAVVLSVENLTAPGLDRVGFEVRAGEILGIGGLPDSGKDGLGEALFGLAPRTGTVTIDGRVLRPLDPAGSIRNGLAFVPADRRGAGGLMAMSVADNVVSASLPRFSVAGLLRRAAIRREARAQVARLDARIARLGQKLRTLSGGNQQKIILGRSLVTDPRVLVLHEPTRGIDVGAKAEIYAILRAIAGDGVAVVLISSEIPELILNAERVLVLRAGRIAGELGRGGISEEAILARAMAS
ncbi:sugar ABC transporter ATP-binding protein [Labrys wisconsinensis]|uniref:Ribose transport system ATP-binding protein n=1 Tax=Labrys wisconsinensis TaxID=425677 RepID=A0ABU0J7F6_9HYPH|nr:sugar ABC transporter ATP-binding protein [Labrys wisconsinensis]MDQ0469471.1 ribose transport system ATP-binding protein [Labrys wisconsinensis]